MKKILKKKKKNKTEKEKSESDLISFAWMRTIQKVLIFSLLLYIFMKKITVSLTSSLASLKDSKN